jgi:hypothetical protein
MDLVLIISLLLLALVAYGCALKHSSPWKGEGPSVPTDDQQRSGGGQPHPPLSSRPKRSVEPGPTHRLVQVDEWVPDSASRFRDDSRWFSLAFVRVFFDFPANHARTPSAVSRQPSSNTRRDPEGAPAASVHAPKSRDARLTPALA